MKIDNEILLINRDDEVLTVLIEPEGNSIQLKAKERCIIRAVTDGGDDRSLRFDLTYKAGTVGVYLMCEKHVFVDDKKVL